jgi:large subunit ribosomal protein L4
MAEIAIVNAKRQEVGTLSLPDTAFAYPYKRHLLYEAVRHFLACARAGTHKAKNRIEVSGGGKKPWKQKGTGRARQGSNRSPLWRHGGVVFGPVPRDYSYDFPRMARRRALASAISEKARRGQLLVVDALPVETAKTKAVAEYLRKGLQLEGKVLIVFDGDNRTLERASRNHPEIGALRALSLHAYDVLNHDAVVMSRAAAEQLGEVLSR